MKKHFTLLLFIGLISTNIFAGNLKAYFTFCTFDSPEKGSYIETYLSIVGNSASYKKTAQNTFQSEIEITLIFKQGEEIKKFKKYNLLSPESIDSLASKENFIDQQRISLDEGEYEFQISIKDLNTNEPPFTSVQNLKINYPKDKVNISDIELIESLKKTTDKSILSKSGYDLIPYTSDFYPEDFEKIAFYAEIYNTNKILGAEEGFLISYYIETFENKKPINSYKNFVREKTKDVNVLLKSFSIGNLPSGNYNLVIEARDKKNDILATKRMFFQRSNPKATPLLIHNDYLSSFVASMDKDDLTEYIKCIEPISSNIEIDFAQNQLNGDDEELMRQYFYNFWITRNETEPEAEWNKYKGKVATVQQLFSNQIKKGYSTDRGRVYLKYGPPNTRSQHSSEEGTYPHEIWHYYKIEEFNNKKFIFHDPNLGMNEYGILHSNMPGYFNNPQWKTQLYGKAGRPTDMDSESSGSLREQRTNDRFNNPR